MIERPLPNAQDRAEAARFIREEYAAHEVSHDPRI